jgi:membrane protein DedA with SNARE-associated domain
VQYLDGVLATIDSLPDMLVYFLLFLGAFIENIFPPAPGDTITAFGAFLVGTGRLHFFMMYISTTLGSFAGFMFLFWIGNILGRRFFVVRDYRFFKADNILRAELWIRKYGYFLILLNRFLPGVRSVISIACGISRLQVLKVMGCALISSGLWNILWISMGYTLGNNWEAAKSRIEYVVTRYNITLLIIACAMLLFLGVRQWIRRR